MVILLISKKEGTKTLNKAIKLVNLINSINLINLINLISQ